MSKIYIFIFLYCSSILFFGYSIYYAESILSYNDYVHNTLTWEYNYNHPEFIESANHNNQYLFLFQCLTLFFGVCVLVLTPLVLWFKSELNDNNNTYKESYN